MICYKSKVSIEFGTAPHARVLLGRSLTGRQLARTRHSVGLGPVPSAWTLRHLRLSRGSTTRRTVCHFSESFRSISFVCKKKKKKKCNFIFYIKSLPDQQIIFQNIDPPPPNASKKKLLASNPDINHFELPTQIPKRANYMQNGLKKNKKKK